MAKGDHEAAVRTTTATNLASIPTKVQCERDVIGGTLTCPAMKCE